LIPVKERRVTFRIFQCHTETNSC